MLRLERVCVFYGAHQVLWDLDLEVAAGSTVCILGPNGAGKSTVLKAIAGLVPVRGRILLEGRDIAALPAARRVALGISLVLERRRLFTDMSVAENLALGAYRAPAAQRAARRDQVLAMLPAVRDLLRRRAGDLSGGQQQMVAMARGLMAEPRLLMLDEPFLGLSPVAVDEVRGIIAELAAAGLTILFNEQNVRLSLAMSRQAVLLEAGRLVVAGPAEEIGAGEIVQRVYFGTANAAEAP